MIRRASRGSALGLGLGNCFLRCRIISIILARRDASICALFFISCWRATFDFLACTLDSADNARRIERDGVNRDAFFIILEIFFGRRITFRADLAGLWGILLV